MFLTVVKVYTHTPTLHTYKQIRVVVALRARTVHHVPVVADEHALLEQRRVRTRVAKLPSETVAHVINLGQQTGYTDTIFALLDRNRNQIIDHT